MIISCDWPQIKFMAEAKSVPLQFVEMETEYHVVLIDGVFALSTIIPKSDPANEYQSEFETGFKTQGNVRLDQRDSSGAALFRPKMTATGWNYQLHGFEFKTALLDSLVNNDIDGNAYGFSNLKLYSSSGSLITDQSEADSECVLTVVDWEPTHDYDMIGGMLKQISSPESNVHLYVVGVPDVPENMGGSKVFVSGVNLRFLGLDEGIKVDGRSPKTLTYNPTYHTNKLRLSVKHSAGFKHEIHMIMELYKP